MKNPVRGLGRAAALLAVLALGLMMASGEAQVPAGSKEVHNKRDGARA